MLNLPGTINESPKISSLEFNPKSKKSILKLWFESQSELARGEQPSICVMNGIFLENIHRKRAPTTYHTIQEKINKETKVHKHAKNLDAGDFSDDEEQDLEVVMEELKEFSNSPQLQAMKDSEFVSYLPLTPTLTDSSDIDVSSTSKSRNLSPHTPTRNPFQARDYRRNDNYVKQRVARLNGSKESAIPAAINTTDIPTTRTRNKAYHGAPLSKDQKFANRGSHQSTSQRHNVALHQPETVSVTPQPEVKPSSIDMLSTKLKRTLSSDDAISLAHKHLKITNHSKGRKRKKHTISSLWFKCQKQLQEGRQPVVLAKYGLHLRNIRQHCAKFQAVQRGLSDKEKTQNYVTVLNNLTRQRKTIAKDEDEFSDMDFD